MIFIDNSEGRPQSKLPHMPQAQYVSGLEELTGADILVSPFKMKFPAKGVTDKILELHTSKGAILVQLKVGGDAIQSVSDTRLDHAIERMQKAVPNSWQRWLVTTGNFTKGPNDVIYLNGKKASDLKYWSFVGALSAWGESGGSYINLDSEKSVPKWLQLRESRLTELLKNPVRQFMPPPAKFGESSILRRPEKIADARTLVAAIPGFGITQATALFEQFKTAAEILEFLSDPNALERDDRPTGIGKAKLQQARTFLGLGHAEKLIVGKSNFPIKIKWPPEYNTIVAAPHGQWVELDDGIEVTYYSPEELEAVMLAMTAMKEHVEEKKQKSSSQ